MFIIKHSRQNPSRVSCIEIENLILKFITKHKTILKKKIKVGGLILPDFKTYDNQGSELLA